MISCFVIMTTKIVNHTHDIIMMWLNADYSPDSKEAGPILSDDWSTVICYCDCVPPARNFASVILPLNLTTEP